jgi:hypothetical protein
MNAIKHLKIFLVFIASFVLIGINYSEKVFAIPVSPDKYYIDASTKKDVPQQELIIYGREDFQNIEKLYVSTVGMKKIGEGNDREFYRVKSKDTFELANWIRLSAREVKVVPGVESKVLWDLNIPDDAPCGTNLASIMLSPDPQIEDSEAEGAEVSFKQEIMIQVHLNIQENSKGKCTNNSSTLELVEYSANPPIFNFPTDVNFNVVLKNTGNIIAREPKGFIELSGFGGKISAAFNEEELDVYPSTSRRFNVSIIDENYPKNGSFIEDLVYEIQHFRIGIYDARLGITKNVETPIVSTVQIFIIPYRPVLIATVIVVISYVVIKRQLYLTKELDKMKRIANSKK